MIKNDYEIRAKKFIREIAPYLKGISVNKANLYKIRSAVAKFNNEKHRKVIVSSGASRIVFVTSDYVIKLNCGTTWAGNCETELLAYNKTKEAGYEYLLAKISHYKFRNRNYYIMPRATIAEELSCAYADRLWKQLSEDELHWLHDNFYDMHSANWGTLNGKLVIIDYAFNRFRK